MSLRIEAALDNQKIIEDPKGFGWPITVVQPDGVETAMIGLSNDIAVSIDPETGLLVSGNSASVSLSLLTLGAKGIPIPRNVIDVGLTPWLIKFNDLLGAERTFKVVHSSPDNTLGYIVCELGNYE